MDNGDIFKLKKENYFNSITRQFSDSFKQVLNIADLHHIFNFKEKFNYKNNYVPPSYYNWKMEVDDQPIFRYIYKNFKPRRHLEFGTWQGEGLTYCLEECYATVWTINPPFGEFNNNKPAYGLYPKEVKSAKEWAKKVGLKEKKSYQTDSLGFIGRFYLEKNYGHRVCQIYCKSQDWDISNYPDDFFDTVLIDGGHQKDIVINDTLKSLKLLRSGGLMMWHDYCPPVYNDFECVKGVTDAVDSMKSLLQSQFKQLFWINPSWILLGIKNDGC